MSEIKLRKCPFCGGEARLMTNNTFFSNSVRCTKCFAGTNTHITSDKAIEEWNQRKPMDDIVEKLEQQAEQYRQRAFEMENKNISTLADKYYGKQCSYLHAIEIVKEVMQDE